MCICSQSEKGRIARQRNRGDEPRIHSVYKSRYGRSGRLWQNRFFSAVVDSEKYLLTVIGYIEENPVRADLAARASDYKWSSAGTPNEIVTRPAWLHSYMQDFKNITGDEDRGSYELIRKSTSSGRPLGSESFVAALEQYLGRSLHPMKRGRPLIRERRKKSRKAK